MYENPSNDESGNSMIFHEYSERGAHILEFSKDISPEDIFKNAYEVCLKKRFYLYRIDHNALSQSYYGSPGHLYVIAVMLLPVPYSFNEL